MENLELLREKGLYPSCVLESGYGLHAYWLFEAPVPAVEARPFCTGLQKFLGSDPVSDPARILRFPGTHNVKDPKNPVPCRVVEASWQRFKPEAFGEFRAEPTKSKQDLEEEREEKDLRETKAHLSIARSRDPEIEKIKVGPIHKGERHSSALRLVAHYCGKPGLTKKAILYAINDWNQNLSILVDGSMPQEELTRIVDDIWAKEQVTRAELRDQGRVERAEKKVAVAEAKESEPWWDDGKFLPQPLAEYMCFGNKFLSTPISDDGQTGVDLYVYENGVYRLMGGSHADLEIRERLRPNATPKRITDVIDMISRTCRVHYSKVNPKALSLINVANGMLDWKTGELKPHDPSYLSTFQFPVSWNPEASSEDLDKFFDDVLPDKIARELVEEYVGYLLVPDTGKEKMLLCTGSGGNGKGTLLRLIMNHLLGRENCSNISMHDLCDDRFAASGLLGKVANFRGDLEGKILENTGKLKSIVSGDTIDAEKKGKNRFTFTPFARLVFSTNNLPRSKDDHSEAYYDRFLIVDFPKRIRGTDGQIEHYEDVLAAIKNLIPALLVKAVKGLRRLSDRGRFDVPESSKKMLEDYRAVNDNAHEFLTDQLTLNPLGEVSRRTLYQSYLCWCSDEGTKPVSAKRLTKTTKILYPTVSEIKMHGDRRWRGVSMTEERRSEVSKIDLTDKAGGHLDF
jgi:putative DNA primase/helicase